MSNVCKACKQQTKATHKQTKRNYILTLHGEMLPILLLSITRRTLPDDCERASRLLFTVTAFCMSVYWTFVLTLAVPFSVIVAIFRVIPVIVMFGG